MTRLPIKYARPFTTLLTITGTPPSTAYIEVDGDNVRVQMGWAFRAQLPRGAVASVGEFRRVVSVARTVGAADGSSTARTDRLRGSFSTRRPRHE